MFHSYVRSAPHHLNPNEAICTDFGLPSLCVNAGSTSDTVKPLFDIPIEGSHTASTSGQRVGRGGFESESDSDDIGITAEQFEAIQNVLSSPNRGDFSPRRQFRSTPVEPVLPPPPPPPPPISVNDSESSEDSDSEESDTGLFKNEVGISLADGFRKLPQNVAMQKKKEKTLDDSDSDSESSTSVRGSEGNTSSVIHVDHSYTQFLNATKAEPNHPPMTKSSSVTQGKLTGDKSPTNLEPDIDLYCCNVCSQPFRREAHLKKHVAAVHGSKLLGRVPPIDAERTINTEKKNRKSKANNGTNNSESASKKTVVEAVKMRRVSRGETAPRKTLQEKVSESAHRCDVCGLLFCRESQLKTHALSHEKQKSLKLGGNETTRKRRTKQQIAASVPRISRSSAQGQVAKKLKRRVSSSNTNTSYDDPELHCCRVCGQPFRRESHLKAHMVSHGNNTPLPPLEKSSPKIQPPPHLNSRVAESKPDVCRKLGLRNKCMPPFISRSKQLLEKAKAIQKSGKAVTQVHLKKRKPNGIPVQDAELHFCSICWQPFHRESLLKTHIATHRVQLSDYERIKRETTNTVGEKNSKRERSQTNGIQPYVHDPDLHFCEICKQPFTREAHLKTHLLSHRDRETALSTSKILESDRNHREGKNKVPLATNDIDLHCCNICGQPFRRETYLKAHILTHGTLLTPNKASSPIKVVKEATTDMVNLYACNICQQPFLRESLLRRHVETHCNSPTNAPRKQQPIVESQNTRKQVRSLRGRIMRKLKSPSGAMRSDSRSSFHFATDFELYCCTTCGQPFRREANLRAHMLSHGSSVASPPPK